jgi:hypothetical protein
MSRVECDAWRVGTKVPINVYDGDRPVCQCQTAADAALIVRAVNMLLDAQGRKHFMDEVQR